MGGIMSVGGPLGPYDDYNTALTDEERKLLEEAPRPQYTAPYQQQQDSSSGMWAGVVGFVLGSNL